MWGAEDFGHKVRAASETIRAMWPGLLVETPRGRVVLYNTGPDVEHRAPKR